MNRQQSLFAILPRAITDAIKGDIEIAVINAPIHVDEHDAGDHVYAPTLAIEHGIIYRRFPQIKWEIDAIVSHTGSVFFTHTDDALASIANYMAKHGTKPKVEIELVDAPRC